MARAKLKQKTNQIIFRATDEEKQSITEAAEKSGLKISEYFLQLHYSRCTENMVTAMLQFTSADIKKAKGIFSLCKK